MSLIRIITFHAKQNKFVQWNFNEPYTRSLITANSCHQGRNLNTLIIIITWQDFKTHDMLNLRDMDVFVTLLLLFRTILERTAVFPVSRPNLFLVLTLQFSNSKIKSTKIFRDESHPKVRKVVSKRTKRNIITYDLSTLL